MAAPAATAAAWPTAAAAAAPVWVAASSATAAPSRWSMIPSPAMRPSAEPEGPSDSSPAAPARASAAPSSSATPPSGHVRHLLRRHRHQRRRIRQHRQRGLHPGRRQRLDLRGHVHRRHPGPVRRLDRRRLRRRELRRRHDAGHLRQLQRPGDQQPRFRRRPDRHGHHRRRPHAGALASNGGPTQTMALQAGSPAIGAGITAVFPGTDTDITADQRGVSRPSSPDLGAFEIAPTSYVVTDATDGPGSSTDVTLRYAITQSLAAGGNTTITFDPSLAGLTIALTSDDASGNHGYGPTAFVIDEPGITIDGSAAPGLTISGDGARRVFAVNETASLTLEDLTVSDGLAQGTAGGLSDAGTAAGGGGGGGAGLGGGVFNDGGTFTADGVTFENNTATGGKGQAAAGGSDPTGGPGGSFGGIGGGDAGGTHAGSGLSGGAGGFGQGGGGGGAYQSHGGPGVGGAGGFGGGGGGGGAGGGGAAGGKQALAAATDPSAVTHPQKVAAAAAVAPGWAGASSVTAARSSSSMIPLRRTRPTEAAEELAGTMASPAGAGWRRLHPQRRPLRHIRHLLRRYRHQRRRLGRLRQRGLCPGRRQRLGHSGDLHRRHPRRLQLLADQRLRGLQLQRRYGAGPLRQFQRPGVQQPDRRHRPSHPGRRRLRRPDGRAAGRQRRADPDHGTHPGRPGRRRRRGGRFPRHLDPNHRRPDRGRPHLAVHDRSRAGHGHRGPHHHRLLGTARSGLDHGGHGRHHGELYDQRLRPDRRHPRAGADGRRALRRWRQHLALQPRPQPDRRRGQHDHHRRPHQRLGLRRQHQRQHRQQQHRGHPSRTCPSAARSTASTSASARCHWARPPQARPARPSPTPSAVPGSPPTSSSTRPPASSSPTTAAAPGAPAST